MNKRFVLFYQPYKYCRPGGLVIDVNLMSCQQILVAMVALWVAVVVARAQQVLLAAVRGSHLVLNAILTCPLLKSPQFILPNALENQEVRCRDDLVEVSVPSCFKMQACG